MKNVVVRGLVILSFLGAGPAFFGCDHDEHARSAREEKRAEVSEGRTAGNVEKARSSIVAARCDREERCSNVGAGKDYENRQACSSKLEGKTGSDLNTQDCSHGVDQPKLSDCLTKIRSEDCGNPIDSLSRLAACRTGEICIGG